MIEKPVKKDKEGNVLPGNGRLSFRAGHRGMTVPAAVEEKS